MSGINTNNVDFSTESKNTNDTEDSNFKIANAENIEEFINTHSNNDSALPTVEELFMYLNSPTYENTASLVFSLLKMHIKNENLTNLQLLYVKAKFHDFIVNEKYVSFIPLYNEIFNDKLYENVEVLDSYQVVLSQEFIIEKTKEYTDNLNNLLNKKYLVKLSFDVDEIVGAKDKSGKWWMSRVLAIYNYNSHVVYYVEFLGWGTQFNEFISDKFRIEKYKPKKHKYFKHTWKPIHKN